MVTAHRQAAWQRTAWICHVIIAAAPFRDGPAVTPDECNPLLEDHQRPQRGIDCLDPAALAAYHDSLALRHK